MIMDENEFEMLCEWVSEMQGFYTVDVSNGGKHYYTGDDIKKKVRPDWLPLFIWRRVKRWYPSPKQMAAGTDLNAPIGGDCSDE